MLHLVLYCAVSTGSYGFHIADCFDSMNDCKENTEVLECTKCFENNNRTVCPSYGAVSYE